MPNIAQSSRLSIISQDFAVAAFFYWLSRCGFKCFRMHDNLITIIAKNPKMKKRFGFFDKIGNWNIGTACELVSITERQLKKTRTACTASKCIPYVAVLIEKKDEIWIFITTVSHLLEIQPSGTGIVD